MQNFAKSILNYFAAYNETRFRFTTRAAQKWSNDQLSLDFSIFPDFQKEIFDQLQTAKTINCVVTPGAYAIQLNSDVFSNRLAILLKDSCTSDALKVIRTELSSELLENTELEEKEVYRQWNLLFRKDVGNILLDLQEDKKRELLKELQIEHLPISTLNTTRIEQDLYELIKHIDTEEISDEEFIKEVSNKVADYHPALVMYDLFSLLQAFHLISSTNPIHLFFHELVHEEVSYPISTLEIQLLPDTTKFTIQSVRDLIQLNTPAINSTKMGNVLTTPRACSIGDLPQYIAAIEMYFQSYFHNTNQFFFQTNFKKLVGAKLPTVAPRMGLQIIEKEDRKLLDYSELITNIDSGAGKKFSELITTYVDDNVENTSREVHDAFTSEFPPKSPHYFFSDIPLSLNPNQKKILTAAKNPKNKIMVIDGPPGTGKSYTITALVYLANLLNKTVLITSHKAQALDVVEETLTKQFRQIHPFAKPPILRLTKPDEKTLNSIDNTLSDAVINQTLNRTHQVNPELIVKDLERIEAQFSESISTNWEVGTEQFEQSEKIQKLSSLAQQVGISIETHLLENPINLDEIDHLNESLQKLDIPLSLSQFLYLSDHVDDIPKWIDAYSTLQNFETGKPETKEYDQTQLNTFLEVIQKLQEVFDPTVPLSVYDKDKDCTLPKISEIAKTLTWEQLLGVTATVKQIHGLNKQLTAKIFGSEDKRRLEHTMKLDYPTVSKAIAGEGIEKVVFTLDRDIELASKAKKDFPWLDSNYILKQSQTIDLAKQELETILSKTYLEIIQSLSLNIGKKPSECTIKELYKSTQSLLLLNSDLQKRTFLQPVLKVFSIDITNSAGLQKILSTLEKATQLFTHEVCQQLTSMFDAFPELLIKLNITKDDIRSIKKICSDSTLSKEAREYITVYQSIKKPQLMSLETMLLEKQQDKRLRLLVNKNEDRFSQLNRFPNDVQKSLKAIKSNQRLTPEQSQVLFKYIPCIIAPPDLISQYFPMESDMLDWLIIDEASQVSIAESLSLMLRARQTIVFGDELQYGAVGATNVSLEYSKEYFRNVVSDYGKDKQKQISTDDIEKLATDVSRTVTDEEVTANPTSLFHVDPNTLTWLNTFGIRTSTLDFAKALRNYSDSLNVHFRSYPEIISYSNDVFYKPSEISLITSRIRTKPIDQALEFIKVETKGLAGSNINLDEIEAIRQRLSSLFDSGYKGSIGIICSFREQTERMKDVLRKDLPCLSDLVQKNNLKIWFVGDVQGEERDIILYSFVEDKKIQNASLSTIYPVIGGVADNIRNLRMQRLNVGFSRAKDTMVFVHSMELNEYKGTRLGDALEHYWKVLHETTDNFISDTSIFGSPAEERLYSLLTQTDFYKQYQKHIRLIAQFEIGKYLKDEFRKNIPNYRVDFLLTFTTGHIEHSLIIEYDGLEFHTKNPHSIHGAADFDQEYVEYDIQRQMELESYGYRFLRINKFTLAPQKSKTTEVDVLNDLLFTKMSHALAKLEVRYEDRQTAQPLVVRENAPSYQSDTYKSSMEEKLDEIIRKTAFFATHKEHILLQPNFSIKEDLKDKAPKEMPKYQVDFLLTVTQDPSPFKLIIEYDGVKYHTDKFDAVVTAKDMEDSLSDDHIYRQYDLEECGYQIMRVNKFILYDKTEAKTPVDIINDLLDKQYSKFLKKE